MPEATMIRPADARDLPELGRLGAELMREHHAFDVRRFILPDGAVAGYARFLEDELARPGTRVAVAERRGRAGDPRRLVGYVYAAIEPESWKELRAPAGFIHDLYVAGDFRGDGLGQRLLDDAITWLRSQGMARVMLWTAAANTGARRLFERHGFAATMTEMTRELE